MNGKLTVFKVCEKCGKEFVIVDHDHTRCLACRVDEMGEPRLFDDDDWFTIRDEFAAIAMGSLLATGHITDAPTIAAQAYVMADAMLLARKGPH